MTVRIEWRTRGNGDDTLIYVGEFGEGGNAVWKKWAATTELLTDYLNDMKQLDTDVKELETEVDERDPEQWGQVVLARDTEGQILEIDPELYWDAIYNWFRIHGTDPHKMREHTA